MVFLYACLSCKMRLVLKQIKVIVQSLVGEQFLMGAYFPDFTFVEHDDFIRFFNGGKSVGDDDRRPAGGLRLEAQFTQRQH